MATQPRTAINDEFPPVQTLSSPRSVATAAGPSRTTTAARDTRELLHQPGPGIRVPIRDFRWQRAVPLSDHDDHRPSGSEVRPTADAVARLGQVSGNAGQRVSLLIAIILDWWTKLQKKNIGHEVG